MTSTRRRYTAVISSIYTVTTAYWKVYMATKNGAAELVEIEPSDPQYKQILSHLCRPYRRLAACQNAPGNNYR